MASPDYSHLDAEILVQIGRKNRQFAGLVAALEGSAKEFVGGTKAEPFRVINRRLQALRKKGKISFETKIGWQLRGADGSLIN